MYFLNTQAAQLKNDRKRLFGILSIALVLIVAISTLIWKPVDAATASVVPNADITNTWPSCSTACPAMMVHSLIDEGASEDNSDWISVNANGAGNETVIFGVQDQANIDAASQLKLRLCAYNDTNANGGAVDTITMNLSINGADQSAVTVSPAYSASDSCSWYETTYSGAWDQAAIDSLRMKFTRNIAGSGNPANQGDTVRIVSAYVQVTYVSAAQIDQTAYRFFENTDSRTPGAALAAQNTPASTTSSNYRLQMLTHVDTGSLGSSGQYKLQFAKKVSGVCSTYNDVTPIMQRDGVNSPTSAVGAGARATTWSNTSAIMADDGSSATVNLGTGGGVTTDDIIATGFGFAIPASAIVTGVEVEAKASEPTSALVSLYATLTSGGTEAGTSKNRGTPITASYLSYGNVNDDWGATLTGSDINASDFGVRLRAYSNEFTIDGDRIVSLDHVRVTVHYHTGVTGDVRFNDNPSVSNEATAVNGGLTHGVDNIVNLTYNESNYVSPAGFQTVDLSEDGLWDFSLKFNDGLSPGTYCFRLANIDGSTAGITSTVTPEITIPAPELDQSSYRFYQNADSATPGAPLANQDTPANIATGTPFRLRQLISQTTGATTVGTGFKLQAGEKTTTCSAASFIDIYSGGSTGFVEVSNSTSGIIDEGGTYTWMTTYYAGNDDNQYSEVWGTAGADKATNQLQATHFGLAIPADAVVTGIEVQLEASGTASRDQNVYIVKNGVTQTGVDLATGDLWDGVRTFGSETELWGQAWAPADINSDGFGFAVRAALNGANSPQIPKASVDYMAVNVHYMQPSNVGAISFFNNPTIADNEAITPGADDPQPAGGGSLVAQTYNEDGRFAAAVDIPTGDTGLWDFSLVVDASLDGKTYCFRVVEADGTPLAAYSQYPEISFGSVGPSSPTLDQQMRGGRGVIDGEETPFTW